ncbi:hypothetical protein OA50_05021 [Mameliella alba]|uniref:FtsK gamma domain-containing protein n=2 Tax=Mameliella alba TaxID=561184 RepID=A0A0B3S153_9RHOB|nr:hypothetical protein OA50_05021 [Mameliella alba]
MTETTMTLTGPDGQTSEPFSHEDMIGAINVAKEGNDPLYIKAAALVIREGKCSTSYVQRELGIGYNRAARMVETMEDRGIVSPASQVGKRDVVAPEDLRKAIAIAYQAQGQITRAMAEATAHLPGRTPMKETEADRAVTDNAYGVAAGELKQFIERVERLEEEKAEIAGQIKEVMAEAKGRGYDTKILKKLIALRKRDPDDIAEEEALLDMYKAALGMG